MVRLPLSPIKITLLLTIFLVLSVGQYVANGVDLSFNAQLQTTTFTQKWVRGLVVMPDGKIIAAGRFNHYNDNYVGGMIRLNSDASLDTTFPNLRHSSPTEILRHLVLPNGKVLMAGTFRFPDGTTWSNTLIRLNSDGSIDGTFNRVLTGENWNIFSNEIGEIFVSGYLQYSSNGQSVFRYLVKLQENGSVDPSPNFQFQHDPVAITNQGTKFIYVGFDTTIQQYKVLRLNNDGTQDATFVATPITGIGVVQLESQVSGKIVVLADNRIFRVNSNGGVDASFPGLSGFTAQSRRMFFLPDGRITVTHSVQANNALRILRLSENGTPDPTFSTYDFLGSDGVASVAVLSDGAVLLGDGANSSLNRFTKLLPNGMPDTGFNPGGTGFLSRNPGKVRAISILPSDKIVIGGDFDLVNSVPRTRIAILNSDSTLDPSFQINTTASGNYFQTISDIYEITLQSDGKFLVSGAFTYILAGVQKRNVVRLTSTGAIDPTFTLDTLINDFFVPNGASTNRPLQRPDGKVLVSTTWIGAPTIAKVPLLLNTTGANDASFSPTYFTNNTSAIAFDVLPLNDGKMLVAGRRTTNMMSTTVSSGYVVRMNSDGTTDSTFNDYEGIDESVVRMLRLPNGRVLAVVRVGGGSQLIRLLPNGDVDNTFPLEIGTDGSINAFGVLPNGQIVVGGLFNSFNGEPRTNLALLSPSGSLLSDIGAPNGAVNCISIDGNGRILIGGDFTVISTGSGSFALPLLLRITPSLATASVPFDFDGDLKTDIGIYRPNGVSGSEWWLQRSSDGGGFATQFGASTDRVAAADYTGDGKTDVGFWRPSTGFWYVLRSEDLTFYGFPFGANGDVPVPADYDADGKADVAVFRGSDTTWYIQRSGDGGATIQQFGVNGDVPVNADYDGDGKADIAIYRPSLGQWWLQRSTAGTVAYQFGSPADKTVVGDYTGDGKADVAFWRPGTGEWFVLRSEDNSFFGFPFGISTDTPVPGDYDGDGRNDAGVFRSSNNTWYINRTTAGTLIQQFGSTGDLPLPNAYVR